MELIEVLLFNETVLKIKKINRNISRICCYFGVIKPRNEQKHIIYFPTSTKSCLFSNIRDEYATVEFTDVI